MQNNEKIKTDRTSSTMLVITETGFLFYIYVFYRLSKKKVTNTTWNLAWYNYIVPQVSVCICAQAQVSYICIEPGWRGLDQADVKLQK